MHERIVVTGMGTVNPLGHTVAETWENACSGVSGAGPITHFDASAFSLNVACEVKNFNPETYMSAKEARRQDRYEQFSMVSVAQAMRQSGLQITPQNAGRVGVIISSAIGGIKSLEDAVYTLVEHGPRRIGPFVIPMLMPNGASGLAAIEYGIKGPCFSATSACASGADGIGLAWTLIRAGVIDAAITGGSDMTICPVGLGSFDRMGALSRRALGVTPSPFDRDRDGLVMAEGAGVLVIERESHARQRGAEILAELAGYAATADAFHITAPSEDGEGGSRAMLQAMEIGGVNSDEIGYINAHGTGTVLNDAMETRAIKTAFGSRAHQIPVSSTKSMTGHMMGATGALEAIFSVQVIRSGVIPPTIHYHTPDPDCDLDYVPNQARQAKITAVLSNSFGFGGHNAVLVFRAYG
jgi:beta-ketoacyl-acyl-carrier-protein synthase II